MTTPAGGDPTFPYTSATIYVGRTASSFPAGGPVIAIQTRYQRNPDNDELEDFLGGFQTYENYNLAQAADVIPVVATYGSGLVEFTPPAGWDFIPFPGDSSLQARGLVGQDGATWTFRAPAFSDTPGSSSITHPVLLSDGTYGRVVTIHVNSPFPSPDPSQAYRYVVPCTSDITIEHLSGSTTSSVQVDINGEQGDPPVPYAASITVPAGAAGTVTKLESIVQGSELLLRLAPRSSDAQPPEISGTEYRTSIAWRGPAPTPCLIDDFNRSDGDSGTPFLIDNFNRSDRDLSGDNGWQVLAGSFVINGNQVNSPSQDDSANYFNYMGTAVLAREYTPVNGFWDVSCTVMLTAADGADASLFIGADGMNGTGPDSGNTTGIEFQFDAYYDFYLGQVLSREPGTGLNYQSDFAYGASQESPYENLGVPFHYRLTYDENTGEAKGYANGTNVITWTADNTVPLGNLVGFASQPDHYGETITAEFLMDDFEATGSPLASGPLAGWTVPFGTMSIEDNRMVATAVTDFTEGFYYYGHNYERAAAFHLLEPKAPNYYEASVDVLTMTANGGAYGTFVLAGDPNGKSGIGWFFGVEPIGYLAHWFDDGTPDGDFGYLANLNDLPLTAGTPVTLGLTYDQPTGVINAYIDGVLAQTVTTDDNTRPLGNYVGLVTKPYDQSALLGGDRADPARSEIFFDNVQRCVGATGGAGGGGLEATTRIFTTCKQVDAALQPGPFFQLGDLAGGLRGRRRVYE